MSKIWYAIDIDVRDSFSGTPEDISLLWSDTSIGLNDGHYYLITGDPKLDGSKSVVVSGEDLEYEAVFNDIWYSGVLKKSEMQSVYQRIDIKIAGNYSTSSEFSFDISNAEKWWFASFDAGIKLIKRPIKFYVVTYQAGDYVFNLAWTGVIEKATYEEETVTISCSSNFKEINSRIPFPPKMPNFVSSEPPPLGVSITSEGITLDKDNKGQNYPVTLGKVNKGKALRLYTFEYKNPFNEEEIYSGGPTYTSYVAPGTAYQEVDAVAANNGRKYKRYYVTVKTGTVSFTEDQLGNSALIAEYGPDNGRYKIIGNAASTGSSPNFSTVLEIEKALDVDFTDSSAWVNTSNTTLNVQYYRISFIAELHVTSHYHIAQYKGGDLFGSTNQVNGNAWIFTDDEFLNVSYFPTFYNSNSGDSISNFLSNFGNYHANLEINPFRRNDDPLGDPVRKYWTPRYVVCINKDDGLGDFVSNTGGETQFPGEGSEIPEVRDRNHSTYVQQNIDMDDESGVSFQFGFKIKLPTELENNITGYDGVYIVLDQAFKANGGGENAGDADLTFWAATYLIDGYGRQTEYIPTELADSIFTGTDHRLDQIDVRRFSSGVWVTVNHDPAEQNDGEEPDLIPRDYYGLPINDNIEFAFNQMKEKLDVREAFTDNDVSQVYPYVGLNLRISVDFASTERLMNYRLKEIAIVTEETPKRYADFDSGSYENDNEYYTSMLGEYYSVQIPPAYVPGDTIRNSDDIVLNIADAILYLSIIYQKQTISIIDPFEEPKTREINIQEFELLANPNTGIRKDWHIGYQIIDTKEDGIFQYVSDLALFGYMGICFDNQNRVYARAWREQIDPIVANFKEGLIVKDTLEDIQYTDISELYNVFEINYDYNYGNQKYNRKFKIDNISNESRKIIRFQEIDETETNYDERCWPDGYEFIDPYVSFDDAIVTSSTPTTGYGQLVGIDYDTSPPDELPDAKGTYLQIWVETNDISGYNVGDLISFAGDPNPDFNFNFLPILHIRTTIFADNYAIYVEIPKYLAGAESLLSGVGSLYYSKTSVPAWHSQAFGFEDFVQVDVIGTSGPVSAPVFTYLKGTNGISYNADDFLLTFTSSTEFTLSGGGHGAIQAGVTGSRFYEPQISGLDFLLEPNGSYTAGSTITLETEAVSGWAKGKEIWDKCRQSWLTYKFSQKLPSTYSDCYWFSDLNRYDATLQDDTNNNIQNNLYNNTAYKYLQNLVEWTTKMKEMVTFEVPILAGEEFDSFTSLLLLDPVKFTDQKLTNNEERLGWITQKEIIPEDDTIKFEITLNPKDYPPPLITIDQVTPGYYVDVFGEYEEYEFYSGNDVIDENKAPADNNIDENSEEDLDTYTETEPS